MYSCVKGKLGLLSIFQLAKASLIQVDIASAKLIVYLSVVGEQVWQPLD